MTAHTDTGESARQVVAVVGSLNADLTVATAHLPRPGETVAGSDLEVLPGGKSFNQAAVVARQGRPARILGAVGTDAYADLLAGVADDTGVEATHLLRLDGATGTAVITVDDAGENTIVISAGANGRLTVEHLRQAADAGFWDDAAVLVLCFEVPMDVVVEAARQARERGITVVLNPSPSAAVPDELVTLTDILIVNEGELADLVGDTASGDVRQALEHSPVGTTIVTLGARGSLVRDGETITAVEAATPAEPVVDTTGCGDAFTGTLASEIARGAGVVAAAERASAIAGIAATRRGAQSSYPDADEAAHAGY